MDDRRENEKTRFDLGIYELRSWHIIGLLLKFDIADTRPTGTLYLSLDERLRMLRSSLKIGRLPNGVTRLLRTVDKESSMLWRLGMSHALVESTKRIRPSQASQPVSINLPGLTRGSVHQYVVRPSTREVVASGHTFGPSTNLEPRMASLPVWL